jgi:glutamate N-acetyltransferase/amino-acid N-acetyltransferase
MGKKKRSGKGKGGQKKKHLITRIKQLEAALALREAPEGPIVSPLAPEFPDLPAIAGLRIATAEAGVKHAGRTDVMLAHLAPGTAMAGVFTRSATRSAAVLDCEEKLRNVETGDRDEGWGLVVNSGNANAFTGAAGTEGVTAVVQAAAGTLGVPEGRVLTSSTGVIGEPLPHGRIVKVLRDAGKRLGEGGLEAAARAIMTTDTFPKAATRRVRLDGTEVAIAGIAKGSGMIAPDMATMLAYIFTDARVAPDALGEMLSRHVETTFNAITVDGDTSTSDTVLLAATGQAGGPRIVSDGPGSKRFEAALAEVMQDLALQIVMDGEGATKLIEVRATGASTPEDARRVARSVANSPLVKTAVAGEDPNWGRVVMAVGKSGAEADRDRLAIRFGEILVAERGAVADGYSEEIGASYMTRDRIAIHVDLGLGTGEARMWTCDLTARYVAINADYRS